MLHSLDAGSVALTLVVTQKCLREGETQHRSRRIVHILPTDKRHLEDIFEWLIRFGFIKESDLSPNRCHENSMSIQLCSFQGQAQLSRKLIIDHSPVGRLLQSPSAVILEIEATLQFWQANLLVTHLDFHYTYLGLRIVEESKILLHS